MDTSQHPFQTLPAKFAPQSQQQPIHYSRVGEQVSPASGNDSRPGDDSINRQGDDAKRQRACEACRGLKVRCDQVPEHPEIPCKRCAKAGRQCIVTEPTRKRQKKADTRVAELEKKLDALAAVLSQQQHSGGRGAPPPASQSPPALQQSASYERNIPAYQQRTSGLDRSNADAERALKRRRLETNDALSSSLDNRGSSRSEPLTTRGSVGAPVRDKEAISQGFRWINAVWETNNDLTRSLHPTSAEEFVARIEALVTPDTADFVFNRYVHQLSPHFPAVIFPAGTTAQTVWRDKPILFLAILSAAAAGTLDWEIAQELNREALGALANCVVRNAAKSLELVQAMQVMALWNKPPEKATQTNFYQIIHMAATMALDIGLGKRFNPAKARRGFGRPYGPWTVPNLPQDSDTLEARRAWLCCYYLCASTSMVLRRPNLIRWTNYMKECIEVLETHPDAAPTDKAFCQHVKIQHICDNIGEQFFMDDNTATVSITDPKVTYALNVLGNDLQTWKENIPPNCRTADLQYFEHVSSLYLHEIALHLNHNVEDFKLPFTEESLKTVNDSSDKLTQHQMAALEACVRAAHGVLDTMQSYGVQVVKTLPMLIFFPRCCYAIVILIKMHVAISNPSSEVGKIMKAEDLRVEQCCDNLIAMFSSDQKFHPMILMILRVLRDWFLKHKETIAAQSRADRASTPESASTSSRPEPLKHSGSDRELYGQTPLHLLSQVATSKQSGRSGRDAVSGSHSTSWIVASPYVMDYTHAPPSHHPDSRMPVHRQHSGPAVPPVSETFSSYIDPNTSGNGNDLFGNSLGFGDQGWSVGLDQAMDLTLGSMEGLSGGWLDNWFSGENGSVFPHQGEAPASGQW